MDFAKIMEIVAKVAQIASALPQIIQHILAAIIAVEQSLKGKTGAEKQAKVIEKVTDNVEKIGGNAFDKEFVKDTIPAIVSLLNRNGIFKK